jgi:DNA repair photolyase
MLPQAHKGRGATSRIAGRFEKTRIDLSGEETHARAAQEPPTELRAMPAGHIISTNTSPDVPFDRSINPYQGCELSPGLDFETKIYYKPNAVERLLETWEKTKYECRPITIGANTDPYQPAEKKLRITRRLLEAFLEHRHPVTLISKGALMRRDLDLLEVLAAKNLCSVAISVPTVDRPLKRLLEPRVPSAEARFGLIEELTGVGVATSLLMAPIIPAINDREIETIVAEAASRGVSHAAYIFLRLPNEVRNIFVEWLETHMPDRAEHVMSLVRQASGGRDYDKRFGIRQRGRGPYAEMISKRFKAACRKHGLGAGRYQEKLDCSQFRRPGQKQLKLGLQ